MPDEYLQNKWTNELTNVRDGHVRVWVTLQVHWFFLLVFLCKTEGAQCEGAEKTAGTMVDLMQKPDNWSTAWPDIHFQTDGRVC